MKPHSLTDIRRRLWTAYDLLIAWASEQSAALDEDSEAHVQATAENTEPNFPTRPAHSTAKRRAAQTKEHAK